jgi:hypothetical protein
VEVEGAGMKPCSLFCTHPSYKTKAIKHLGRDSKVFCHRQTDVIGEKITGKPSSAGGGAGVLSSSTQSRQVEASYLWGRVRKSPFKIKFKYKVVWLLKEEDKRSHSADKALPPAKLRCIRASLKLKLGKETGNLPSPP